MAMKIEKIVLTNYTRFNLRQIKYFEYIPNKKTQAILGSNGSGKSSLLEELSPLPANSKHYETGGSKKIWISHKNHQYYLASLFNEEGNLFIFERDGAELNDGHTVTGYRELVKEHFNYTKDVHAILTGKTKFTGMSVNERRVWFMAISQLDYQYAITYYKRVKEHTRSLQGALSRTQERLVQETSLLLPDNEVLLLASRIQEEKAKLDILLSNKPLYQGTVDPDEVNQLEMALGTQLTALESLIGEYSRIGTRKSIQELYGLKNSISVSIATINTEITSVQKTILGLQQQLKEYNGLEGVDVETLDKEVNRLEQEVKHVVDSRTLEGIDDYDRANNELEGVCPHLYPLLEQAEALSDINGSSAAFQAQMEKIKQYQSIIKDNRQLITLLKVRVDELTAKQAEGEIACPSCNHRWILNYNAREHQIAISELKLAEAKLLEHEATLNTLSAEHTKLEQFLTLCHVLEVLMSRYPSLQPLWCKLIRKTESGKPLLLSNPATARHFIEVAKRELTDGVKVDTYLKTIQQHKKIIQIAAASEKRDKDKLSALMEKENMVLAKLLESQRNMEIEQKTLNAEITLLEKISDLDSTCNSTKNQYLAKGKHLVLKNLGLAMQEASYQHAIALSGYEKQRSHIELRKSTIQSFNEEIVKLKQEIRLLLLLEEALSPSTGLIAKGMTSFINNFVYRVNEIIALVWRYPLEIVPVEVNSEDELDYRFVVKANGVEVASDVAEVSEGMKEIINLSFVLASMESLSLNEYPVFLDEFATKLDAVHRDAAYAIIDYLAESSDFSQLFLISHYESGYVNLADAETIVLCPANVSLPKSLVYNQNCVIA